VGERAAEHGGLSAGRGVGDACSAPTAAVGSATTAAGSEIVEHRSLAGALLVELGADLLGEGCRNTSRRTSSGSSSESQGSRSELQTSKPANRSLTSSGVMPVTGA
jgi:hypothetical protein